MSLIKCPECRKDISSEANVCIHCGYPLQKKSKAEPKIKESKVIAYRGGAAYLPLYIISIIFAGLGITAGILLSIFVYWLSGLFLYAFSIPLLVVCIIAFARVGMNNKNKDNCIIYDADKNKLILSTLQNKRIEIDPNDYVSVRYGFSTDLMLMMYYRLPDKRIKKVNLGYCENRESVRQQLDSLKD